MNDRTKIEAGSIGNIFINKRKAACCDPRAGKHMQLFCDLCLQKNATRNILVNSDIKRTVRILSK